MSSTNSVVRLSNATLSRLAADVRVPAYDHTRLEQSTVHIGVGGFHRAHQAVYLDDLLHKESSPRWGECGIGLLAGDSRMRDALIPQDCLYTVVERSAQSQTARVIGSMVDYVYAPEHREKAIEKMAAEEARIVSLTVTEGGYFINEGDGEFTSDHGDIQHDLQHPGEPCSSLGYIAEAMDRRRRRGLPPFTVMSCDNLQGNGHVAKRVLLAFAELRDPLLSKWIAENAAFPNSMVDRITPASTPKDVAFVQERFGFVDAWPVVTEPFIQWVIEDEFCDGRPRWEEVGAELVTDVAPYELMKMRLLNGSHMAMAYLGALFGYTYVHEVMQDERFSNFIAAFMEEVTPVVPRIPGTSVTDYKKTLMHRFSNPTINDQVTRICSEGSAKMPKWVLPSAVELLEKGGPINLLSLVIASWIHYLKRGVDERGRPLDILDARAAELTSVAKMIGTDPRPMLSMHSIFGRTLPENPAFVAKVEEDLQTLEKVGSIETIRRRM